MKEKNKKCKVCKDDFYPENEKQIVCGWQCALTTKIVCVPHHMNESETLDVALLSLLAMQMLVIKGGMSRCIIPPGIVLWAA